MKVNFYQIIKDCLPRIIIWATIILIILNLYLIYQNVWQIFTYSKENPLIEGEILAAAELKFDLFKKIEEKSNNRQTPEKIDFDNLENPFILSLKRIEEPQIEEPKIEEPKIEEPKIEEPKIEEPKIEEPKIEEPKIEEPKIIWVIPAGYKYIPGPSKLIFYTNIISEPGSINKYGIPKYSLPE